MTASAPVGAQVVKTAFGVGGEGEIQDWFHL